MPCQIPKFRQQTLPNVDIQNLDPSQLKAIAKGQAGPTVVMFSTTWCGHCKTFAPTLDEAAPLIHDLAPEVKLRRIDAEKYARQIKAAGITVEGYPTLLGFGGASGSGKATSVTLATIREPTELAYNIVAGMNGDAAKAHAKHAEDAAQMKRRMPAFAQQRINHAAALLGRLPCDFP
jgi:thiol-disulfide isomerase/thioredoxin